MMLFLVLIIAINVRMGHGIYEGIERRRCGTTLG
jgi:hypothetical protein